MKTKKIIIAIIISVLFLLPITIKADDNALTANCTSSSVPLNGSVTCTISATAADSFTGVKFNAESTGSVTISNITGAGVWSENGGNANYENGYFTGYSSTGIASGTAVATIDIAATDGATVGDSGSITFSSCAMTVGDNDSDVDASCDPINLTIGDGSSEQTTGDVDSSNPKTMDTNVAIIITIVLAGSALVVFGKKKLNRLSR